MAVGIPGALVCVSGKHLPGPPKSYARRSFLPSALPDCLSEAVRNSFVMFVLECGFLLCASKNLFEG